MTRQKSFKRLVRAQMEKTDESYTAARTALLSAEQTKATEGPTLTMSEESILRRSGRGWEEWFDLLDESGAAEWPHPEIARWLAEEQGIAGWDAQSVTVSYERARGGRAVGQRPDGFSVTASKTVAAPVERLYDAFVEKSLRERWLRDDELAERTATRPKSARFDWGEGETRVIVGFTAKGEAKSTVALEHARLVKLLAVAVLVSVWQYPTRHGLAPPAPLSFRTACPRQRRRPLIDIPTGRHGAA